jgi:uncharacterized protein
MISSTLRPIIAIAALLVATALEAQDRALGDWHGILATPAGNYTLVISITEAPNGGRAGALESIDQQVGQKIPLANVTASAERIAFAIPSLGASYQGDWNESEQTWTGQWSQGGVLPLRFQRGKPPALPNVEGLDGTWRATLPRGSANLRLVLRIRTSAYGTRVRLDSPDVGAMGIEVQDFGRAGDTVQFRVPAAQVEFRGVVAGSALGGTWARPGQPDARVTFARDSAPPAARQRTQWPITPRGYRAEDVSFANPDDARVTLAGTLTLPDGPGPFPAAVLISGSGPQDRDETIFGHRPFAVLADHLSQRGVAVLRYDDRGVGRSRGDHANATSADFATDANAAVQYLRGRPEIQHRAIGFVGHSEGGMIAPIAAVGNDRVAFLVMLAGPGTRTDELVLSQRRLLGESQGLTREELDRAEPLYRDLLRAVREASDSSGAVRRVQALLTDESLTRLGVSSGQREFLTRQFTSPWMRYFVRYDPAAFLPRLRVPVLALNGSLDRQVPAAENLAALRTLLSKNRDATVRELPGLNHFFQAARTGALGEYETIAETFAPSALEELSVWIVARFGPRGGARSAR